MTKTIVVRGALLLVSGVSIYLLLPGILEVFSSWPTLRELKPAWLGAAVAFEALSFLALWEVQRISVGMRGWFSVGTSQLAANAAGRVIPGGGAASGALQYRMLVRAGADPARVASGLTATLAATTAALLALPALALVAAAGGAGAPQGLLRVAYLGLGAFVLVAVGGGVAFLWDRPLVLLARGIGACLRLVRRGDAAAGLPERLLAQRDAIAAAFAARPWLAVLGSVGKWGFEYGALVCVLAALSARPRPELVLLAYTGASLLGMIPITPGGLGFVEAGLTGMLVLAGVGAEDAAVATLAYRLVSFWVPLPAGLVGLWLFRRRYGSEPSAAAGPVATTSGA